MYNRICDSKDPDYKLKFAKAVLQKDFVILNAEEPLYDFLGKNSASFFNKLIRPDCEEEFLFACHSMKPGDKYSIITFLRDKNDNYHPLTYISACQSRSRMETGFILPTYIV